MDSKNLQQHMNSNVLQIGSYIRNLSKIGQAEVEVLFPLESKQRPYTWILT